MASFNDPQFSGQWQLKAGTGINIASLYDEYTGKGVRIGLIDTMPVASNAELKGQIDWSASVTASGTTAADDADRHGHSVATLLVAKANNGTGGVGAAFGATLVSYTVDTRAYRTVAQETEMLGLQWQVDISHNSWSRSGEYFRDNFASADYAGAAAAMAQAAAEGRGGLGTIFVRSAGNNGVQGDDVNTHSYSNNRYTVLVGATDEKGAVQNFSNTGAALLVVAPGTATSFSAPLGTATVALMLEANPNLGYRDVQTILALSARLTDATGAGWFTNAASGWNGGGMHVSNGAGFGLIDAHAAIRLAESWEAQSTAANLKESSASSQAISTLRDLSRTTQTLEITEALSVERVEVQIQLQHDRIGDLRIWLVSPSGTQSVLLDRLGNGSYDAANNTLSFTLSSVQFLGESSQGSWMLRIYDAAAGNTGTLKGWTLTVLGSAASADTQHVYTDEFATLAAADPSRAVLADATGEDTLNGAALTAAARLDLSGATASQIAGQSLRFAAGTVIEHAIGGDGDDVLIGNGLANHLRGNRGDDRLEGGAGDDQLEGGAGNDTLLGGSGQDTLDGGTGDDVMTGGAGNDLYIVDSANDRVVETQDGGVDTIRSSVSIVLPDWVERLILTDGAAAASSTLLRAAAVPVLQGTGNAADNILTGGEDANRLFGMAGNDVLEGGGGDDELDGGAGNDVMVGGLGDDTYVIDSLGDRVVEVAGEGTDTLRSWFSLTLAETVENLELLGHAALSGTGNAANNLLTGNDAANRLSGLGGDDILLGLGGDDILIGGSGNDRMEGGTGNDTYYTDSGTVTLVERAGEGTDKVYSSASLTLSENIEILVLTGTARDGTGNAADNTIYGNAEANLLRGGAGDDVLEGGAGNDRLEGGSGADILRGGTGADLLIGGTGNDIYVVDDVGDQVVEVQYQGYDTVRSFIDFILPNWSEYLELYGSAVSGAGNAANNVITGNGLANILSGLDGGDVLRGMAGDDMLLGGAGGDVLEGGEGNDLLDGGEGGDRMVGGAGNDTYRVDTRLDTIVEVAGGGYDTVQTSVDFTLPAFIEALVQLGSADLAGGGNSQDNRLVGNGGHNRLLGMDGNDLLQGGAGDDTLLGAAGRDRLEGGEGRDRLQGGADADTFVIARGGGQDVILDFRAAEGDTLVLTGFGTLTAEQLAAATTRQGADLVLTLGTDGVVLQGLGATGLSYDHVFFG
ncbi:proprotein convertase P-domain-containing protein [Roseomonas sp. GC11]|uniref:proprotein convertase P-domain-containing protein n=1 Tax=Roseomonas sp. GC11 TaxID=2950546 RepID=UPI00210A2DDA|nr:proprotein convertase P-domain-containing protein [Roseomonas sp. GC11]MCQ4160653.1 proprotein convertase P-domain-containing protein [Roseomonas sp. GC11]